MTQKIVFHDTVTSNGQLQAPRKELQFAGILPKGGQEYETDRWVKVTIEKSDGPAERENKSDNDWDVWGNLVNLTIKFAQEIMGFAQARRDNEHQIIVIRIDDEKSIIGIGCARCRTEIMMGRKLTLSEARNLEDMISKMPCNPVKQEPKGSGQVEVKFSETCECGSDEVDVKVESGPGVREGTKIGPERVVSTCLKCGKKEDLPLNVDDFRAMEKADCKTCMDKGQIQNAENGSATVMILCPACKGPAAAKEPRFRGTDPAAEVRNAAVNTNSELEAMVDVEAQIAAEKSEVTPEGEAEKL